MSGVYFDYRFRFPITGLATALQAMAALRTAGLLGAGDEPENMLGDPRDASGAVSASPVWAGRPGSAAGTDPASYYIHIRATVSPDKIPFNPADYGLTASDPAESAAVLGVWA